MHARQRQGGRLAGAAFCGIVLTQNKRSGIYLSVHGLHLETRRKLSQRTPPQPPTPAAPRLPAQPAKAAPAAEPAPAAAAAAPAAEPKKEKAPKAEAEAAPKAAAAAGGISAALVKELRESTGAGMMDCKKALGECDGDLEKAKEVRLGLQWEADRKEGRCRGGWLVGQLGGRAGACDAGDPGT